jgi:Chaperone of endosialidase
LQQERFREDKMAFVNLPPALQEMFYKINDRVAKIEAGPSQAMYTAEYAQGVAYNAQGLAESAAVDAYNANIAAAQALNQSSQAIQKSAQTITNASNQLTAINTSGITVYSGASSTSGARVLMNSLGIVAYNSINVATLTIDASNGSISMLGDLTSGSTVSGATITGGVIQTSTGNDAVVLLGASNALGVKSGGVYAGFIESVGSGAIVMHYGTTPGVLSYPRAQASSGAATLSGTSSSGFSANNNGTNGINGTSTFFASVTMQSSVTMGTGSTTFEYLSSSGTLRSSYTYGKAVTGRAMQINSTGDFGTTASTRRKKHDIQPYAIDGNALLQLQVKKFKYNVDIDAEQKDQHGFIAEEAQDLGLNELIQLDKDGIPDYFAYEKLPIFLLQLVQELDKRITLLEGK